jgi:hypothetical protein
MSSLQRNVAGQNIGFQLVTSAGAAVTAGGTGQVSKDGGAQAGLAGTLTHLGGGQWNYAPTQAETNGTQVAFQFNGTSGVPIVLNFFTDAGFGIKKNVALAAFPFEMTDLINHNPAIGLTVSVFRSIDGGAFAATATPTATEIGNGMYYIPLAAADLNGGNIALRFTAASADDLNVGLVTTP